MPGKNSLSLYLFKEGVSDLEDIFDDYTSISKLQICDNESEIYYYSRDIVTPKWVKAFFLSNDAYLKQASSQAVLINRLTKRFKRIINFLHR